MESKNPRYDVLIALLLLAAIGYALIIYYKIT